MPTLRAASPSSPPLCSCTSEAPGRTPPLSTRPSPPTLPTWEDPLPAPPPPPALELGSDTAAVASPSTPPAAKPQNYTRLPSETASSSPPAPARCTLPILPWRELGSEAEPTRNQRCKLRHSCRGARSMTSHSRAVSSTHCTPREYEQAHEQLLTPS
uniref:Uncharacterized protein n=1 Tax=Nelumbo nucifera TaxID=4432 RepID=A0A822Y8D2_NELNU|nr:TPA_asm: hypothetical protein HUJ06_030154 [Nelumbo nucifera]